MDVTADRIRKILSLDTQRNEEGQYTEMSWGVGTFDDDTEVWVAGNWNNINSRVVDLIEKVGGVIYWSDEVSTCGYCYKLLQTQPSSYWWQPDYIYEDGELVCVECFDEDDYLESVVNNPSMAINLGRRINLEEKGWTPHEEKFYYGFHTGMNDTAHNVYNKLKTPNIDVVFEIVEVSQFYIAYQAYYKDKEEE